MGSAAVALLLPLALALPGAAALAHGPVAAAEPLSGPAYEDLKPAHSGPCRGGYMVDDGLPGIGCTHGPDPYSATAAAPGAFGPAAPLLIEPAPIPCIGDGGSGPRVEAIYARASDRPDQFSLAAPVIEASLGEMVEEVRQSAEETDGYRTIRFATAGCDPVIRNVVLSPEGDDSIGQTATELHALGFDSPERDYLVFADATVYCGIGYVDFNYARVDSGCWSGHTALHELTHNLGAVQLNAPNSSGGFHCTDESDVMCYSDEPNYPAMRQICPLSHELLLDCNHDDYFSTAPQVGSFLSTHPEFNAADRPFLADVDGEPPVFLPEADFAYTGPEYSVHAHNADDDECVYGEGAGTSRRVRFFCIGNRGDRTADVTGALLSVAGGSRTATLRLVATDRGGGNALGFTVFKDGVPVLERVDGQAGVSSAGLAPGGPDPITGWPVIYEETLAVDLAPASIERLARRKSKACRKSFRRLRRTQRRRRHIGRSMRRLHRSLKRHGTSSSRRRQARQRARYRHLRRQARALKRQQRKLRRNVRRRC